MSDRETIIAAMRDAESKAWEAASGYKFWMFGYHAARWVNYNSLLPQGTRFQNPFRGIVDIARKRVEETQGQLALLELQATDQPQQSLEFEGDGG